VTAKQLRAVAYTRISDDRGTGDDEGLGVQRQADACTALADKEGYRLLEIFTDNSVSAWKGKDRPAWKRLLAYCMDETVDVVIAFRDDRLWRDVVEERQVSQMLAKYGVTKVQFTSGRSYDLGDVDDQFMSGIGALFSQHESAVKSYRTRKALEQRAMQGRWLGGRKPYGYRRPTEEEIAAGDCQPGGLVVIDEEAEIVREIARRVLAGETSLSIAADLNDRGITCNNMRWDHSRVRELMVNPIFAGLKSYNGEVVAKGRWEPILERATHEALAGIFKSRKRGRGRAPRRLLTGVLVCDLCGTKLTGNVRRGVPRYICKKTGNGGGCGRLSISSEPTDAEVRDRVLVALADSAALAQRLASSDDVDLVAVTEQLRTWESKLEQLADDYYLGELPRGTYTAMKQKLEELIGGARQTLADATIASERDLPVGDFKALSEWWEAAGVGKRRALISAVVERVVIRSWDPSVGRRWSPTRIEMVWRY
jgi:DNA invertase Pin-like site-specific DNA recombinase